MRMLVSTTMMTVGGTRFTKSSGSSCADAVAVHHMVMPTHTTAAARRRARAAVCPWLLVARISLHSQVAGSGVHLHVRERLARSLYRCLSRPLVQLLLAALRDLAALDLGTRRARHRHFDGLPGPARAERLGADRQRAVRVHQGIAVRR